MGKGAFVQITKYGGSGGTNHMRHNLREKTRRELQGMIERFGDWDSVMELINTPPIRKSQKTDYMEVVAYPENKEQAEAILQYLSKETNRPVAGVWHYDESKPHVHFIVPWRDETGRALRLQKSQLRRMRNTITVMVGREIVQKGQGRKKIPGRVWYRDEEYYRDLAKIQQERIERAREGIKQVLKTYDMGIQIFYLNRSYGRIPAKGKVFLDENKSIMVEYDDGKVKPLNIRSLVWHNYANDEEITFSPYRYGNVKKKEKDRYLVLRMFIDDIPQEMIPRLPPNTLLVETSRIGGIRKYQAHFKYPVKLENKKYSKEQLENIAKQVFRKVVEYYKGDPGSKDPYHLRKLPGFENKKYTSNPPQVKIVRDIGIGKDWVKVREELKRSLGIEMLRPEEHIKKKPEKVEIPKREVLHDWRYFYNKQKAKTPAGQRVDLNRVDMDYAIYLYSHGVMGTDIKDKLEKESYNIAQRKKGHLEDYLDRTLSKALERIDYVESIRRDLLSHKIKLGRKTIVYVNMMEGYPEIDILPVKKVVYKKNGYDVAFAMYEDGSIWKDGRWFKRGPTLAKLLRLDNSEELKKVTEPAIYGEKEEIHEPEMKMSREQEPQIENEEENQIEFGD